MKNTDNEIDVTECRYWDECTRAGYDAGYEQGREDAFNEIINLHESLWATEMGWEKSAQVLSKIRDYCDKQIKEQKDEKR